MNLDFNKIKYILLDLDGTLIDSAPGITRSVAYALEKMGVNPPPLKELVCFVGPPLRDSFTRYFGFSAEESEKAVAHYREFYAEDGLFDCSLFEGVMGFLDKVNSLGKYNVLATAKPTPFAKKALEHLGALDRFYAVEGASFSAAHDKKSDIIASALKHCGNDLSEIVMVGDRNYDILGAKDNGILSIGVINGSDKRAELEEAGAELIVEDFTQLLTYLS